MGLSLIPPLERLDSERLLSSRERRKPADLQSKLDEFVKGIQILKYYYGPFIAKGFKKEPRASQRWHECMHFGPCRNQVFSSYSSSGERSPESRAAFER